MGWRWSDAQFRRAYGGERSPVSWWKSHPERSHKAFTLGELRVREKLIEERTRIEGTYRDMEGRKPAGAHGDALSCSKPDVRKSSAWGKGIYVDANRVGRTGRPPPVEHSMDRWAMEREDGGKWIGPESLQLDRSSALPNLLSESH